MSRHNKWFEIYPLTKKVGHSTYHFVKYDCCKVEKWANASHLTKTNGRLICRNCSVRDRWANHRLLMKKFSSERRDTNGYKVIFCKECKVKLDKNNIHKNTYIISRHNFGRCINCARLKKIQWRNKEVDAATSKKARVKYWYKYLLLRAKRKRQNKVNVNVSIDQKWILAQYNKQNKKCYWTGVKLVLSDIPQHPFKPSLDRLEVNGPYSPQNTVISALSVNIGRNENSTENLRNFFKLISQI